MADALDPVRFSRLKAIARSPAHYQYELTHPSPDTVAMRRGRYTDAILFGSSIEWAIYPGDRRGKAWYAFEEKHAARLGSVITAKELAPCEGMAAAIRRNPTALDLILNGTKQQTIGWSFLGRSCSGTPDCFNPGRVVDLKTTRCAQPERFQFEAKRLGYLSQLAWYMDGVAACGLGKPSEAFIVAVESTPPHPVTVLRLTDNAIDLGRRACRLWMERLLQCEATGEWPGYVQGIVDLDVETDVELTFGDEPAATEELEE